MAVKNINIDEKTFNINYEILNHKGDKDFIILHGWGSNKEIMKGAFSKILPNFRHIYIDMPGFGKSGNDYILTTDEYSKILDNFLNTIDASKDIVAGHSFGGKVSLLLNPKLLVLLSNSGILVPKPLSVKVKIKLFKFFKLFGGSKLLNIFVSKDVAGMSQNMYETFKKVVDEDFTDEFSTYRGKTLIFWGKSDTATPLWTGEMISKLIKNSRFYPLEGDHYFFLQHSLFIERAILEDI
jgi:pimeloyl-ACP methyl ester carboxylesterase